MIKKSRLIIAILILFNAAISFAQSKLVRVNPLTGTANVTIPIYEITRGQVALPISLSYNATGVKPKDVEATAGMNWQLNAGGQVSRQVRGLPDDCTPSSSSAGMYGWISASDNAPTKIAGFGIANNGSTCSNETADISYINTNFSYQVDTEPDIFSVSAPGLSCEFIYNRSTNTFQPINYQDIVITYTTDGSNLIHSFTITNDRGIKYVFAAPTQISLTSFSSGTPAFFTTAYNQNKSAGLFYYGSWSLTSMTDPYQNGISLTYKIPSKPRVGMDSVSLYVGGASSATLEYYTQTSSWPQTLYQIKVNVGGDDIANFLTFNWTNNTSTSQNIISSITGLGKNLNFYYDSTPYLMHNGSWYTRQFLAGYADISALNTPVSYGFSYYGQYIGDSGNDTFTTLPDSSTSQVDYWGYFSSSSNTSILPKVWVNPSDTLYHRYQVYQQSSEGSNYSYTLPGNVMTVDTVNIMAGSLSKITYIQGGSTSLIYQSNDYVDVPTGNVVKGGGIRIKQIIDSVASGSTNNIIRNYSYVNPSTHVSSGKPVSLPEFAFTIPYSGAATGLSLWEYSTALSKTDLSNEDHTIMYQYATVSQPGAGSVQYQYYLPATNWDNSAAPDCSGCATTEWYPTKNYAARTNCSLTYGQVNNSKYNYPFINNPNYDFERGMPAAVISYNSTGGEVSETDYTYQRSNSPGIITAFHVDENINGSLDVKGYNKYNIYFNTSELTATVTKKVFDSNNSNTSQSSVATYTYGSTNHKLPTQQSVTNSDGSVLTSKYSYVKDYNATAGSNANITALSNLKLLNINAPVESYQQLTIGGSTLTTGAALTLFSGFTNTGNTQYQPSRQLKMIAPDGLTNFAPFTINSSAQTTANDSRYVPVVNYDTYDYSGALITSDDTHNHYTTTVTDNITFKPISVFANAAAKEVAFADFDSTEGGIVGGFSASGSGSYAAVGSHTGISLGVASTQTITSATLTKNTIAQNYIFSVWINAAASGILTLTLTGISTHPTINYSGGWKYYELKIPASGLSSSYTVSFTTSQNISVDDILFYPDIAEVTTVAYNDTTFLKTAQTNTNGVSAYYKYDEWGRNLYTYDRDRNILQKNTYVTAQNIGDFSSMTIRYGTLNPNVAVAFSVGGVDISSGAKVTWTFGDGSAPITTAVTTSPTHTYTATGAYTVTAAVSSPYLGSKTLSSNISVVPGPVHVNYVTNTFGYGDVSQITFTLVGNSTPSYTLNAPNLNGVTITGGNYNITVTLSDGKQYPYPSGSTGGYTSLSVGGNYTSTYCQAYHIGNSYTFSSVNLTNCTTATFTVSQLACGGPPE